MENPTTVEIHIHFSLLGVFHLVLLRTSRSLNDNVQLRYKAFDIVSRDILLGKLKHYRMASTELR